MKRAYVTGGSGFIGINLIHELVARGWQVTALHRPRSFMRYLESLPIDCVEGDVKDIDSIRATMPHAVDVVFHVAGNLNMWARHNAEQERDNVEGPRNVAAVALERKAGRFVHTSSIAAYGTHRARIKENTPSNALGSWINYPRTKALGEREVQDAITRGLDAVILNPANVVGAYDRHNWSTMVWLASRGRLFGAPPGRGSFCHVREVVKAHLNAVERGRTGENYLLGGTDAGYLDATRVVGQLVGRRVPRRATPSWVLWTAARLMTGTYPLHRRRVPLTPEAAKLTSIDLLCSNDKAQRDLDHQPVSLEKMFADCWRWMVDEGRIDGPPATPSETRAERAAG